MTFDPSNLKDLAPVVAVTVVWASYAWLKDRQHKQEIALVHKEVGNAVKDKTVAFMSREKELIDLLIEERKSNNTLLFDFIKELRNVAEKLQTNTSSNDRLVGVIERMMLTKQ